MDLISILQRMKDMSGGHATPVVLLTSGINENGTSEDSLVFRWRYESSRVPDAFFTTILEPQYLLNEQSRKEHIEWALHEAQTLLFPNYKEPGNGN